MEDQDEDYHLPLIDQRVFGAGITRKRIQFVPPAPPSAPTASQTPSGPSISKRYLSIVLPPTNTPTPPPDQSNSTTPPQTNPTDLDPTTALCEICHLPIPDSDPTSRTKPHESSIAHQTCLPHSDPPSHLPRGHIGLKYLESYGWDPDARTGLGAEGQGIRIPIKGKVKSDTVGLGVKVKKGKVEETKERKRLNAKEVRRAEMENKRKAERLREKFYRSEDVEKYFGEG